MTAHQKHQQRAQKQRVILQKLTSELLGNRRIGSQATDEKQYKHEEEKTPL